MKAHFNLAVAYGASPNHGSAKEIEQLRKVIELAPTFDRAHLALGKALLKTGQIPDAVTSLQEAVRLEPKSGEANYQLGLALARAGRKEEAAAALKLGRELVALDDRNQNASLDIAEGRAALEKGELEQAAARLRRAVQLRPDSADAAATARHGAGEARERRRRRSRRTGKALEVNPADVGAKARLEALAPATARRSPPARPARHRRAPSAAPPPTVATTVSDLPALPVATRPLRGDCSGWIRGPADTGAPSRRGSGDGDASWTIPRASRSSRATSARANSPRPSRCSRST